MNIKISTFKDEIKVYDTQEEWDAQTYSLKSYDKRWLEINKDSNSYTRRSSFSTNHLMVARHEPKQFPVLAIKGMVRDVIYGPITIDYIFIYRFEVEQQQ